MKTSISFVFKIFVLIPPPMLKLCLLLAFFYWGELQFVQAQSSVTFDGIDDKATVVHHNDFNIGTGSFTIEAQVQNLGAGEQTILSKRSDNNNGFIFFVNTTTQELTLHLENKDFTINNAAIIQGQCLFLTAKRSGNNVFLGVNNNIYSTSGNANKNINSTADLMLGKDGNNGNNSKQPLNGSLVEIRLWNTARTNAQILANQHNCFLGTAPNLIAYWNIEEANGQFLHDVSNHNHHAYLGNSFFANSLDPVWGGTACLTACCGVQAGFIASVDTATTNSVVFFTTTNNSYTQLEWFVDSIMIDTSVMMTTLFSEGIHTVSLKITAYNGCVSYYSLAIIAVGRNVMCEYEFPIVNHCNGSEPPIYDMYGNCFSRQDIAVPYNNVQPLIAATTVFSCGIFDLAFTDFDADNDLGFDTQSPYTGNFMCPPITPMTRGEKARESVCAAFIDVSFLITDSTTYTYPKVRVQINSAPMSTALATGQAMYQGTIVGSPNFIKSAAEMLIQTGVAPYPATPTVAAGFHGIITFRRANKPTGLPFTFADRCPEMPYHNNEIYDVTLHEIGHILGITSFAAGNFNDISGAGGSGGYTYYDNFIYKGNTKAYQLNPTPPPALICNICPHNTQTECPNNHMLKFGGSYNFNNNQQLWFKKNGGGSRNFHHYNCQDLTDYVMSDWHVPPSSAINNGRNFHEAEVQIFCDLGYNVSGHHGNPSSPTVNYRNYGAICSCPTNALTITVNPLFTTPPALEA